MQVSDGQAVSSIGQFHVDVAPNHAPTLTVADMTVGAHATLQAFDLFSATDADSDPLTYYFEDNNAAANSGHFIVSGTVMPAGTSFGVNEAQLADTVFVTGASGTSDAINMQVSDGHARFRRRPILHQRDVQRLSSMPPMQLRPRSGLDCAGWRRASRSAPAKAARFDFAFPAAIRPGGCGSRRRPNRPRRASSQSGHRGNSRGRQRRRRHNSSRFTWRYDNHARPASGCSYRRLLHRLTRRPSLHETPSGLNPGQAAVIVCRDRRRLRRRSARCRVWCWRRSGYLRTRWSVRICAAELNEISVSANQIVPSVCRP